MKNTLRIFSKKAVSAFLSLMIVISAVSGIITNYVASATETPTIVRNNITTVPTINNPSVVSKVQYRGKKIGATKSEPFDATTVNSDAFAALIDGTAEAKDLYGCSFANKPSGGTLTEYSDGSTVYFDIIYTLNSKTDISDIVVVGRGNPWDVSYKLYASNTMADLFDNDNLIYTHTEKGKGQHYELTNTTAKHVAMRVTSVSTNENGTANASAGAYNTRLAEFNVFGTPSSEADEPEAVRVKNSDSFTTSPIDNSKSVVNSVRYYCKKIEATDPESLEPTFSDGTNKIDNDLAAITDGQGTCYDIYGCTFAKKPSGGTLTEYSDGTTAYFDIVYTLDSKTDLSDIVVIGKTQPWELSYKLYASKTREDLFESKNLIYTHTEKAAGQHYEVAGITAKYVAMRVTAVSTKENGDANENAGAYITRLAEFNVYGTPATEADDAEIARVMNDDKSTSPVTDAQSVVLSAEQYYKAYGTAYTVAPYKPGYKDGNGVEIKDPATVLGKLTDGNASQGIDFYKGVFAFEDSNRNRTLYSDGTVYYDIVYELNGKCNISDIVVIGNKNYWKLSYELYISDNKYDLFKGEPIYTHTKKKQLQHFELYGITAKYVGMRVTSVTTTNELVTEGKISSGDHYPRLSEFNVYGTPVEDNILKPYLAETKAETLSAVSVVDKTKVYYNNGVKQIEYTDGDTDILADELVGEDGDLFTGDAELTPFAKAKGSGIELYTDRQLKIEHTLKGTAKVSDIFVYSNEDEDYITQEYKIYAAKEYDDLYKSSSLVYSFSNPGKKAVQIYDVNLTAKYIAMVITKPCTNKAELDLAVPSLYEFNVYGEMGDDYDPDAPRYPDTSKMDLSNVEKDYGKNLLKYENISYYVKDIPNATISEEVDGYVETMFSTQDNNVAQNYDLRDLKVEADKITALVFKLTDYDTTKLKGFALQSSINSATSKSHTISHYKVFMAEEKEDLFLDSSLVFEYKVDDITPIQKGVFYEIPEGEQPIGKYIAFQIVDPVNGATNEVYPRICYLWAWGEEAIIPVNPDNLAENMPVDAYFANGNDKTEVSNKNLTPDEVANLTDDNANTYAKIDTKLSKRDTLELLYNLCSDVEIDKIKMSTLINSSTGFSTLKVYAADSVAEIYQKDALVWTYKVNSTGTINATKSFKTPVTARYFRFVFQDTKDYVQINEIEIIGGDNQKLKTRNLTALIDSDNVTVTRTNKKTDKTQTVAVTSTLVDALVDSSKATALRLLNGTIGKDKYDIILYLGDLRTISKINLNFFGKIHSRYNPKAINVYVAETEEEIYSKDIKPTFSITKDEIDKGSYAKIIRPTLARYVRVEVTDFNKIEYFKNDDGTYPITAAIADVEIFGTRVDGLMVDEKNKVMVEFKDKKTGLKFGILPLGFSYGDGIPDEKKDRINDVFTDAVSIRVTEEKATNWQATSLQYANLAIIDKTVYKIELLDLYGNVIKDIGGRGVRIVFPTPKKTDVSKLVIGDASERTTVTALDTSSRNKDAEVYTDADWKTDSDNKFTLTKMVTFDDSYWETIGELEDFQEGSEEDLLGGGVDAAWYDSIHTTDGIFTVTPLSTTFQDGLEFVAADITATAPEERCVNVLSMAGGKDIAIYYDMKFYLNGDEFALNGEYVDVVINLTDSVKNNFTDLEVYHIDEAGYATPLWCDATVDGQLTFQTDSFSDFVIVGTATNENVMNGTLQNGDGASPETGEGATVLVMVLTFMVAAAYVIFKSYKKHNAE